MADAPAGSIGGFVIGESAIGEGTPSVYVWTFTGNGGVPFQFTGASGQTFSWVTFVPVSPPEALGPTSIQNIIEAYPYVQYQWDDAVTAYFTAFNIYAQAYLTWFNALNLPIYTQAPVEGNLLNWVAEGLYGISRPSLTASYGKPFKGPVNTYAANTNVANGFVPGSPDTFTDTSDDTFRRIITWAFFKGDGKTVSPRWLKRRINRFLNGANGTDIVNDTQYNISVAPTAFKKWTITIPNTPQSQLFKTAVMAGALELPFQIDWTVTLI